MNSQENFLLKNNFIFNEKSMKYNLLISTKKIEFNGEVSDEVRDLTCILKEGILFFMLWRRNYNKEGQCISDPIYNFEFSDMDNQSLLELINFCKKYKK